MFLHAAAFLGADALDGEAQVGAGALDLHPVGAAHEVAQRLHARRHAAVVQRADAEVEILERLGAHAGLLGHGGGRPAQHDPLGLVHPVILHRLHQPRDQLHAGGGHVGGLEDVARAAQRDVGVHLLHAGQLHRGVRRVLGLDGALHQLAGDAGVMDQGERQGAAPAGGADQGDDHGVGHVEGVDQHALALLQAGRKAREQFGQLVETGIDDHARQQNAAAPRPQVERAGRSPAAVKAAPAIQRRAAAALGKADAGDGLLEVRRAADDLDLQPQVVQRQRETQRSRRGAPRPFRW